MQISASVDNTFARHFVSLVTAGAARELTIAPREGGFGSSANGGELLCLALATCYCNDVYREAAKRGIAIVRVAVEAQAEFGAEGDAAHSLRYRAHVVAKADEPAIRDLMGHVDRVAEIQNTLRQGMEVLFEPGRAERAP
jgi:organic hydroperoxide reductase OsmC/OhrA